MCQQKLGITHYTWRTSQDERVRHEHVLRDGRRFAWDNPPDDGHPGQPIRCRCVAEPYTEHLMGGKSPEDVMAEQEKVNRNTETVLQFTQNTKRESMRTDWGNFPDTIIDRKLGDATGHPNYAKAKAGDVESAFLLAKDLISDDAVSKLSSLIGDKKVVFAPVHAEEQTGRNMIPVAVATFLARKLGAKVDLNVVQAVKVSRSGSDGWYRLANSPSFSGSINSKNVIMVDDTQTQGGTFAALKGHIESKGGGVIGSYALTGKQYSAQLRLDTKTLDGLRSKYGELENWWQETFGYDFTKLTEYEAKFIINSRKTPDEVRDRVFTAKQS